VGGLSLRVAGRPRLLAVVLLGEPGLAGLWLACLWLACLWLACLWLACVRRERIPLDDVGVITAVNRRLPVPIGSLRAVRPGLPVLSRVAARRCVAWRRVARPGRLVGGSWILVGALLPSRAVEAAVGSVAWLPRRLPG
jgi:hypothetical protein